MEINYEDRVLFKAIRAKWELIQAIRSAYWAVGNTSMIYVQKSSFLIRNRNELFIESLLDGFKNNGLFRQWEKENDGYYFTDINETTFSNKYLEIKNLYEKLAEAQNKKQIDQPNRLVIHKSGNVEYYVAGSEHNAIFKISSNDFQLLWYLAQPDNQFNTFEPNELAKHIDFLKNELATLHERRIRDTIQHVRKKLQISKTNDPFIISGSRFGLNCQIEFAK